jgi:hypothetical protein
MQSLMESHLCWVSGKSPTERSARSVSKAARTSSNLECQLLASRSLRSARSLSRSFSRKTFSSSTCRMCSDALKLSDALPPSSPTCAVALKRKQTVSWQTPATAKGRRWEPFCTLLHPSAFSVSRHSQDDTASQTEHATANNSAEFGSAVQLQGSLPRERSMLNQLHKVLEPGTGHM